MLKQDLHIHTIFSRGDRALVKEQRPELIAAVKHAEIIGISDHIESIKEKRFETYKTVLKKLGFRIGTEVDGARSVKRAIALDPEYFVYHCRHRKAEYEGIESLLATGKPVIIAHPLMMGTDLNKVSPECYVEINNRYVWRNNWRMGYKAFVKTFRFVFSSDAHQPNWLNQNISKYVARELGVEETIIF